MSDVRRLPVDDELLLDDELVVLVGQRVVLLSPLASYTLGRLDADWTPLEELRRVLVQEYGDPGRDDAVEELLRTLAAEGLAELRP